MDTYIRRIEKSCAILSEHMTIPFDRNVPRKPRLIGGVKGHNIINDIPCREAPLCACHPVGRGGELHMGFRRLFFTKEGSRTGLQSVDSERGRLMIRGRCFFILGFFLLGVLLSGCPKKIPPPVIIEKPSAVDPMAKLLETFSFAESLQAKASIRLNMVRNGQEMNFPSFNGVLLYRRPDRFRLLGYHPFGMGLFDALYNHGEFFLLIPLQKRAYQGEISKIDDLMEKAGPIEVFSERAEGSEIPNRIRIEIPKKEIRVDLKLKDISLNSTLPEDAFEWILPEGVDVQPLSKLLKKKLR